MTAFTYTPEIADKICEYVENGMALSRVCKLEGMPTPATVYRWLRNFPEFNEAYTRAKDTQLEMLAEEILEIADDGSEDKGNNLKVQRDRLKVDSRKFLLERLRPDKYGTRNRSEVSGPNGGPIPVEVDKEQLARYVMFLASKKEE